MKWLSLHCLFVKIKLPGFCTCLCWGATFTAEISALFSLLLLEIPGRLRVRCKFIWQRPLVLLYTLILFCIGIIFLRQIPSLHILIEKKKQFLNRLIRDITLSLLFNQSKHWRKNMLWMGFQEIILQKHEKDQGLVIHTTNNVACPLGLLFFWLCVVGLMFAGFDSI